MKLETTQRTCGTRARNQIHAVVIRNLGGRAPGTHTFSKKGREWLAPLELPADERAMLDSCLREAEFLTREIAQLDREIARYAVGCAEIRRLMTIPGIDVTTAATLMATIGRIDRFPSTRQLVGYIGLDARSRAVSDAATRFQQHIVALLGRQRGAHRRDPVGARRPAHVDDHAALTGSFNRAGALLFGARQRRQRCTIPDAARADRRAARVDGA